MKAGYFNDEKREYVIKNMYPKRPWINYIWNDEHISSLSQFGFGMSRYCEEGGYLRNLLMETDNRLIFIRDEETGEYFAANRNYDNKPFEVFETTVGQGYSVISSRYKGIDTNIKIVVPTNGKREYWEVTVENKRDADAKISLFAYANLNIAITGHAAYSETIFDKEINGIYGTHEAYQSPTKYSGTYFASNRHVDYYETSNTRFKGEYSDIGHPIAMNGKNLASKPTCFENDIGAAMQFILNIPSGKCERFIFMLGASENFDDAKSIISKHLNEKTYENENEKIFAEVNKYQNKIVIKTPDENIDRRINIWLKRQMDLGKQWGRVYGKGFRDVLQDTEAYLPLGHEVARKKIINALNYQRFNGNPMRMWDPIMEEEYTDGAVWLIFTLNAYLKETNDFSILDEIAGYYDNVAKESVLKHCLKGMNYLQSNLGEHGLCLWGCGDWNDSLNGCGVMGKGESVWLSEATVKAAKELAEILIRIGSCVTAAEILEKAETMKKNIIKFGWDRDHFIYGINDIGEKIGSYESSEGQIYLNSQTWAVMSGTVDGEKAMSVMQLVEDKLKCPFGYVQNVPSYSKGSVYIGRSSYFKPGCFENGSVYNHGVAFKIVADCWLGKADVAYDTVKMMLPENPHNSYEVSGVEPYAITNMYLGPECTSRCGYAPFSWITGTCGWLFRGITEGLLGINAGFDGLELNPCLPSSWDKVNVIRDFRNCIYDIEIENGGNRIYVDGELIDGNVLPIFDDNKCHVVKLVRE